MATPEEQITPADAAIVTTGTGRKGPEEHDLPESLKYDMDLCLEILRNVLGEYNPELLSTFDTVRHYAVEASAEHFAELKDPNPDQDGLKEAVNVIDNMTLHDAQLLARAFATYFHLANLSEENYRVSVLHERENNVSVDQAVDPINELTVATTSSSMRLARPRPRNCSTSSNSTPSSRRTPLKPVVRPWKARSAAFPNCLRSTSASAARIRRNACAVSTTRSTPCSAPLRSR